jgi:hypothetical protein
LKKLKNSARNSHLPPFANRNRKEAVQGEIQVIRPWTIPNVPPRIPESKRSESRKTVRVKLVLHRRMIQPAVTHAIGPVRVADVCVVQGKAHRERRPILRAPNPVQIPLVHHREGEEFQILVIVDPSDKGFVQPSVEQVRILHPAIPECGERLISIRRWNSRWR